MSITIIGVMGPGEATEADCLLAYELGRMVAQRGWALLTGGRPVGVMHAASKGAKSAGGLTIGILPTGSSSDVSPEVDIAILTAIGEARNVVNVLSSKVILVCGMSSGTASEVALALKVNCPVVLVGADPVATAFFRSLGTVWESRDAVGAIDRVERILRGE